MKKLTAFVTATLITGIVISGSSVFASSQTTENLDSLTEKKDDQMMDSSNFMKTSGVITDVKKDKDSTTLIVEDKENESETHILLSEEALLFSSKTTEAFEQGNLEKGMNITAYYDKNKPMIMIYPPRITPEIIIVNEGDMGQVKISQFDDQFVSLDNDLKLNIAEETILLNENGKEIKQEDLHGKELMVFYDVSTKSIPAQTTPNKIIALNNQDQLFEAVQEIVGDDYYIKSDKKLLPVRKVAEHLGYKVKWHSKQSSVELTKQNQSIQIHLGKEEYSLNRSIRHFEVIPVMINHTAYVSEEILGLLLAE
ncbi:hypothetical protein J2Z40_004025 [Cytobacillus eiseniae]|uniref:Copper amine oxidase-like N-terminal domain-containing protein n=1 Tax=Cytobacillus eiseniae TaxID=762947 RepID=A0ABS4RKF1_9BACI|nr:stalk domain-containing protein [Cytobacillus eiseniae]MBP2243387.1 hypothetical protein [Cytobacillus eiseniae]